MPFRVTAALARARGQMADGVGLGRVERPVRRVLVEARDAAVADLA